MSHKKKANEPQIETCDICGDCGTKLGTPHEFPVTYWNGKCDYCERRGTVTSVRDFNYPDYKDMTNAWDKPLDCIPQLDHKCEEEGAQDRFVKPYCAKMDCGQLAVARIKNAWWCEEHFHDGRKLLGAIADVDKMVEDERIVDTNKTIQAQDEAQDRTKDEHIMVYCVNIGCREIATSRRNNMWWCDEHYRTCHKIECEEEGDGSLSLHIPDDLVQKIVQAFIENALYEMVRENKEQKND